MAKEGVGSELKLLSRHSSIYGLTTILQRLAAFILLPIYTRYLTPADYGVLDLLYLTTAYIGMTMEMGVTAAMSRFYFDSDKQEDRNLVVSTTFLGFGLGSLVFLMIFLAGSKLLTSLIFSESRYAGYMILALIGLGLDMFNRIGYTYLRIRKRSFTLMVVSLGRLILTIGFTVLFLVKYHMGIGAMLWGTIIAYTAQVLFLIPYTLRETGLHYSWSKMKEMIQFGLPLVPSEIMAYIVNTSDRYFLNAFHGLTVTGLYSIAYRFGVLINRFVANPFNQIWLPRRFEMFQHEDSEWIFSRIFTYFCVLVCFGGLGISVLTKDVLCLITEKSYWSAYIVVPILVLSYCIASFHMHFNIGILIKKKTKYILYINAITAAINLTLNYFLIRPLGIWGAAWATLLSFMVKSSLIYLFSNRLVKIVFERLRLVKTFAFAGILYWPISQIEVGNSVANLSLKSAACLAYPALLLVTGFFTRDEIKKGLEMGREILGKFIPRFRKTQRQ